MRVFLSIALGVYLFVVSFFFFVPFASIVNTYSSFGDVDIEAYEALKDDGVSTMISYQGSDVLEIESENLIALLLANVLNLGDVEPRGMFESLFPAKIDSANVIVGFWSPHKPSFYFSGDFGEGSGSLDLVDGVIKIEVIPEVVFKNNNSLIFSKARVDGDKYIFEYKL